MLRLQKSSAILAIMTCTSATLGGLIEGPADLPSNVSGHSRWGIRFTALKNSWLRSFDYSVQNNIAGRVELINTTTATTVFANDHAATMTGVVEYDGLAVGLSAGHVYELVGVDPTTASNNAKFSSYSNYGASASISNEIDVTSGVLNNTTRTDLWFSFQQIETEEVPEPGTLGVCALLTAAFLTHRRWLRRKPA